MATSKLYKLVKEQKDCERKISELTRKNEAAIKEMSGLIRKNFGRLRDFIARSLYDEFSSEHKEKINEKIAKQKKEEDERKLRKQLGVDTDNTWYSPSYSISRDVIFDPFVDNFEINDYILSKDKKSVKFCVECLKNRSYLGLTGSWIPDLYYTGWISMKDLVKEENATTSRLISS